MKNPRGILWCLVTGDEARCCCYEVMHVEENNPAIIEIISTERSNVVESLSCQIQALIKCLGLVKKKTGTIFSQRNFCSQSRSLLCQFINCLCFCLDLWVLFWSLGLKEGWGGKKGEITELEMGGSDDKEQLNRLRIFILAKKQLKMKMIKIYIGV